MSKQKRNVIDKLNTLIFGKDLRITEGDAYKEVRQYDFSSYYPQDKYIFDMPLPTKNVFDVLKFGAVPNDENVDNSKAINNAIEEASKANGTVIISGGDFYSSTIVLQSNITLFIQRDSSVIAKSDGKGFTHKAFVYASFAENVTLTGGGKIKGQGNLFGRKPFLDKNVTTPDEYIDVIEMRKSYRAQLRFAHPSKYGGPLCLENCKNIEINNFIIENSAYWTFRMQNCQNINVKNFVINNNRNVANSDGFDLVGGKNINVSHCFVSTADDGIVLKNAVWLGSSEKMENFTFTDCQVISRTNAFKIGTETTADIKNITVKDCSFFMTDLYPGSVSGISIESCDGSVVSGVNIENIKMDRCTCPIFIRLGNRNRAASVDTESANAVEYGNKKKKAKSAEKDTYDMKSEIKDVVIKNVVAKNVEIPIIVAGYKQKGTTKYVENVTLKDIDITYANIPETVDKRLFIPEYVKVYPECWRFRNLPSYGVWARHTNALSLINVKINHPLKSYKKEYIFEDSPNLTVE